LNEYEEGRTEQATIMTRGRWILVIMVAGSVTAAATLAYKQWPYLAGKIRKQPAAVAPTGDQISSVPPFSTKEPDRYRATRIIIIENTNAEAGSAPVTSTQSLLIARDGENRREEFNSGTDAMTVYLESSAGRFLLLPGQKLYADLNSTSAESIDDTSDDSKSSGVLDFSPDRLLHETSAAARYQTLGAENLAGRKTTKYRVTSGDASGGIGSGSVTLIWIDDELGMPIRCETSSVGGDHPSKVTTELRDIVREVDARLFELPPDYKKVDYAGLRIEILRAEKRIR